MNYYDYDYISIQSSKYFSLSLFITVRPSYSSYKLVIYYPFFNFQVIANHFHQVRNHLQRFVKGKTLQSVSGFLLKQNDRKLNECKLLIYFLIKNFRWLGLVFDEADTEKSGCLTEKETVQLIKELNPRLLLNRVEHEVKVSSISAYHDK